MNHHLVSEDSKERRRADAWLQIDSHPRTHFILLNFTPPLLSSYILHPWFQRRRLQLKSTGIYLCRPLSLGCALFTSFLISNNMYSFFKFEKQSMQIEFKLILNHVYWHPVISRDLRRENCVLSMKLFYSLTQSWSILSSLHSRLRGLLKSKTNAILRLFSSSTTVVMKRRHFLLHIRLISKEEEKKVSHTLEWL